MQGVATALSIPRTLSDILCTFGFRQAQLPIHTNPEDSRVYEKDIPQLAANVGLLVEQCLAEGIRALVVQVLLSAEKPSPRGSRFDDGPFRANLDLYQLEGTPPPTSVVSGELLRYCNERYDPRYICGLRYSYMPKLRTSRFIHKAVRENLGVRLGTYQSGALIYVVVDDNGWKHAISRTLFPKQIGDQAEKRATDMALVVMQ